MASHGGQIGGRVVEKAFSADSESQRAQCEAKRRLVAEFDAATAAFSSRVTSLNAHIGTSSREEDEQLRRAVDAARMKSEHPRLALEHHVAQHGC